MGDQNHWCMELKEGVSYTQADKNGVAVGM